MGINSGNQKLLDKYGLQIKQLDYSYLETAKNVKEVENILKVLRSGEEGIYPDLIKFCENRLREISPGNKLLEVTQLATNYCDLPHEEQASLQSDIKTWIEDIKIKDKGLKNSNKQFGNCNYPIRNTNVKDNKKTEIMNKPNSKEKKKLLSYKDWDKFDVDKEIEKIDQDEIVSLEQQDVEHAPLLPFLDTIGLSESEKMSLAEKEKIKGNECFKEKDYINSTFYYSRSISAYPTVAAISNRAFANIKLCKYEAAILDCDEALKLEPNNVKVLYRRGLAHKELGKMQLAYMDFQTALECDPACKEAKAKLEEINKCPISFDKSKTKAPIIEEIDNVENNSSDSIPKEQRTSNSVLCEQKLEKTSVEVTPDKKRKSLEESEIKAKTTKSELSTATIKDQNLISSNKINKNQEKVFDIKTTTNLANQSLNDNITKPILNSKEIQQSTSIIPKHIHNVNQTCAESSEQHSVDLVQVSKSRQKMTSFKFLQLWHNQDANKNPKKGAEILLQILPTGLPSSIGNQLNADLLYGIIAALREILSGDWLECYQYMKNMICIPRFNTVFMLLSSDQKCELKEILQIIEENQKEDMENLKKSLL